jgi:hypothetical protein
MAMAALNFDEFDLATIAGNAKLIPTDVYVS